VRQANPAARVPDEIEMFMERNLSALPGDRCSTATEFRNLLAMAVEGHLPDPSTRLATEPPQRTHTTRYPPRPAPPPPPPPPAPVRPTDRRRHARSAQMKNVVFRLDGVEHKATTTDLSPGGAFLACRALPPIGTRIEVYSSGSARESGLARAVGEVVRVVQAAGGPSAVRGFALRWVPSDPAASSPAPQDKTPVPK
jgi:hypothetical protein